MNSLWQLGILLLGAGACYALVQLGFLFSHLRESVIKANMLFDRNSREIEDIIVNLANFSNAADGFAYRFSNFPFLNAILGISRIRRSMSSDYKKSRRKRR